MFKSSRGRGLAVLVTVVGMTPALAQPVADFQLTDVNPRSQRYGAPVSPRDYILQVSGFYFGSAG